MFNLWQSNFVKERAAISFPSAVVCLGHCSPMLPGRYRCLWLLWDSTGDGTVLFSLQQSSLGRETLWLCGTDFAVKQTQDLSKRSWGVVCECEPLETKLYGDSPWPVSRNTPICEEKEQKEKKAKCFPLPQGLEGTEGTTWHCTAWRISFLKTAWLHRSGRGKRKINEINTRNGEEYLEKQMWLFYWFPSLGRTFTVVTTSITYIKLFHFLLKDFKRGPHGMEFLHMERLHFATWKGNIYSPLSNLLQQAVQQRVYVRLNHEYEILAYAPNTCLWLIVD